MPPSTLQFYYSPGACSFAAQVALTKTGIDYATVAVPVRERANLRPEYLAVNPRGRIPALVVDGRLLTETTAIIGYLDERFPEAALLPRAGLWERAKAAEWLSYFSSTVHPLYRAYWKPDWFTPDESAHKTLSAGADQRLVQLFAEIDAALATQSFLLGERATAVDYYAAVFARWGSVLSVPSEKHPRLWAWLQRVVALPEVQAAAAREGIDPLRRT